MVGARLARWPRAIPRLQKPSATSVATTRTPFSRADLEHELHLLFGQQRTLGNLHAGAPLEQAVRALLFARKPTLSGTNLLKMVGHCKLEPMEFRAPKASHTAERF